MASYGQSIAYRVDGIPLKYILTQLRANIATIQIPIAIDRESLSYTMPLICYLASLEPGAAYLERYPTEPLF